MTFISDCDAWKRLSAHGAALKDVAMKQLFEEDEKRAERFSLEAAGLFLDYSKNKITADVFEDLIALAVEAGLDEAKKNMFSGVKINTTEDRAVLHVALRDFAARIYRVDGKDVSADVVHEREKMNAFVRDIHSGARKGYSGEKLDTVVNIGIGGSDLGPQMAVAALAPYWSQGRRSFFVSNVDGHHLASVVEQP